VQVAVDGLQSAAVAQGVPLCHVPAMQTCGTLPAHCVLPGTHWPPHAPLRQTNAHRVPLTHWPEALQVWGVRPSGKHCLLFGTQTPQMPAPMHRLGQGAPSFWNLPVLSQSCGCWPLQVLDPGVHEPAQVPPVQTN
jgi:hypothetical protein